MTDEETPILSVKKRERGEAIGNDLDIVIEDAATDYNEGCARAVDSGLTFVRAIPATVLMTILSLMLAVPFGSAYFSPIIPLGETEREALGIRLSLFALALGQAVMGCGASAFDPISAWQLGELSPFYHHLAAIAAAPGDEEEIFPTTLYLMSLSTLMVGLSFFLLGRFGFGQLTYFIPSHVLFGLVGGLGVWMALLSISVSVSPSRAPPGPPIAALGTIHFLVSVTLTIGLRILRHFFPKEKFMLLDPVYFLSIPLIFYAALHMFGIDVQDAVEAGYFFKNPDTEASGDGAIASASSQLEDALKIWASFDVSKVRWESVFHAMPTLLTSGLMAVLITAPFIPPIGMLQGKDDFDFNREFVAHGYANLLCAVASPGGLAVSCCYSTTVVYKNSGGKGKLANALWSMLTLICFVYGPHYVEFIPRCMAGSLVLDLGVNLFLEAVVDPVKKCDFIEYTSIWMIILIMNAFDMTAGLVAGLLAAVFTYTLQSFIDKDPVRMVCDAAAIPSSKWRNAASLNILEDPQKGRSCIAIFQCQGQIFFGNMGKVEQQLLDFLYKKRASGEDIQMVILDFSLVLGIDASAAIFFEKMNQRINKQYDAGVIMVSGPLALTGNMTGETQSSLRVSIQRRFSTYDSSSHRNVFHTAPSTEKRRRSISTTVRGHYEDLEREATIHGTFFETLDEALISCEDKLIAQYDMSLLFFPPSFGDILGSVDEVIGMLQELLPDTEEEQLQDIIKSCRREKYKKGATLWNFGSTSMFAVILIKGTLVAFADEKGGQKQGRTVGETRKIVGLRSLILREKHLATIMCKEECSLYVLDRQAYEGLVKEKPKAARALDMFLAQDLSRRLQHVSNKMYLSRNVME